MDIKTLLDLIANQGFPIALSILLIFHIDIFMQEIITAQKEGYKFFFSLSHLITFLLKYHVFQFEGTDIL